MPLSPEDAKLVKGDDEVSKMLSFLRENPAEAYSPGEILRKNQNFDRKELEIWLPIHWAILEKLCEEGRVEAYTNKEPGEASQIYYQIADHE